MKAFLCVPGLGDKRKTRQLELYMCIEEMLCQCAVEKTQHTFPFVAGSMSIPSYCALKVAVLWAEFLISTLFILLPLILFFCRIKIPSSFSLSLNDLLISFIISSSPRVKVIESFPYWMVSLAWNNALWHDSTVSYIPYQNIGLSIVRLLKRTVKNTSAVNSTIFIITDLM